MAKRKLTSPAPKRRPRAAVVSRAPPPKAAAEEAGPPPVPRPFPIAGIGASAGGLEALELFLTHVPKPCGMAFVVVQHLEPTRKDMMVELLERRSTLPVLQVTDGMKVEPEHVYVIPPNTDLSILHGVLHLLPPAEPRGLRLPIDFFFRALAEDQQDHAIGVVLSGMGTDGTLGLRCIKEHAGATFVQTPATAKFEGMPLSAVDSGLADVVAPAEELPGRILAYRAHAPHLSNLPQPAEEQALNALEKVLVLLRTRTGTDYSAYKRSTLSRRVERRMGLHQFDKLTDYLRFLRENPKEMDLLSRELLIGVTSFFRDPAAWQFLEDTALPELLATRPDGTTLRAWVPGCSTGEEAYSLAMVFKDVLRRADPERNLALQIFATDLDRDAVERARQGCFPASITAEVPPERLRRYFTEEERGYRVAKEIRETVIFAPQNLVADPPFTKLDILSCRNLLIYLSAEAQRRLIPLFHYALQPQGLLFLGSAETVGSNTALFTSLDTQARLYRRAESSLGTTPVEFPVALRGPDGVRRRALPPDAAGTPSPANLQALTERVLLQDHTPPAVLTNQEGDILFISGRTGKYLEPPAGKANWNLFAMTREGLRHELHKAFMAALRRDGPVRQHGGTVEARRGSQAVDLAIHRLREPPELVGTVLTVFTDVPGPAVVAAQPPRGGARSAHGPRQAALEREVQHAREEVRAIRNEMQASREELESTNEELQSTNEELQSANEELTTSKEEMQSLNEELQTVNQELQAKLDELSRSGSDVKNLLDSTDIATLFLDNELRVRRFTNQTARIIKLIPGDAGRPITDITTELHYPELVEDARDVLRTLRFRERLVDTRDGRWFAVRVLPYRTLENLIDGVVLTFADVTEAKRLEHALHDQASQLQQMAEALPNLIWGCRADGACDYVSQQWKDYTGVPEAELLGAGWLQGVHPDELPAVRSAWKSAVQAATAFRAELRLRSQAGSYRWFRCLAVPVRNDQGALLKWYGTATDVDELRETQRRLERVTGRLEGVLEAVEDPVLTLDRDGTLRGLNAAAERVWARPRAQVQGQPLLAAFPEFQGTELAAQCQQVLEQPAASRFATALEAQGQTLRYTVRVVPEPQGVVLILRPGAEERGADGP